MEVVEDEESHYLQNLHSQLMWGTCLKELYKEMLTKYFLRFMYEVIL